MHRRRSVLLALQESANRCLADIRRGGRVIVVDLHVARDLAEIGGAGPQIFVHWKLPPITMPGPVNPLFAVQRWMTTLPRTVTAPWSSAEVQLCATTLPPITDGYWRPSMTRRAPGLSCPLPPMFACEIVQDTLDPTKTLPVTLPDNEPVHTASAADRFRCTAQDRGEDCHHHENLLRRRRGRRLSMNHSAPPLISVLVPSCPHARCDGRGAASRDHGVAISDLVKDIGRCITSAAHRTNHSRTTTPLCRSAAAYRRKFALCPKIEPHTRRA